MEGRDHFRCSQQSRIPGIVTLAFLVIGALGGCAQIWNEMRGDFGPVRLAPSVTRACYLDPCAVTYTLPAGADSYTVLANDRVVGSFPAGQPAYLGAFGKQDSPVTIKTEGVDRSAAVLFILDQRGY